MRADECDKLGSLLSAHADGELDGADRERVERHLAGCADCRERLESYREMDAAAASAASSEALRGIAPEVPAEEWRRRGAKLRAAVRPVRPASGGMLRRVRRVAAVLVLGAAAALVLALVLARNVDEVVPAVVMLEPGAGYTCAWDSDGDSVAVTFVPEASDLD